MKASENLILGSGKYSFDRDKDIWEPTRKTEKEYFVTYPDSFVEK